MRSRCFFALQPPPEPRGRIAGVARRRAGRARSLDPARLHMTLAFLGACDDDEVQAAIHAADSLEGRAFKLVLDELGCFAGGRVLWFGPSKPPPRLVELTTGLRERLAEVLQGLPGGANATLLRNAPFIPHVTLARRAPAPGPAAPRRVEWAVDRFLLLRSTPESGGHVYQALREWPLR